MKPLFADTSFYIALLNQDDELFPLVKPYAEELDLLVVTPSLYLLRLLISLRDRNFVNERLISIPDYRNLHLHESSLLPVSFSSKG